LTSGKPFHREEIDFVEQNMQEFPSILSRSLGFYFPEHNGGTRSTKSVSRLMNKIRTGREPNSPDTPEDEAIEPNTPMRDLPQPTPAVAPVPMPAVSPIPTVPVAKIGTKAASPTIVTKPGGTEPGTRPMVKKPDSKKKGK
jgi:hypothetical protein